MKKQIKFILGNLFFNALNILIWTSLAYAERGYSAIGGEWLCIIACALAAGYISAKKMEV